MEKSHEGREKLGARRDVCDEAGSPWNSFEMGRGLVLKGRRSKRLMGDFCFSLLELILLLLSMGKIPPPL